MMMRNKLFIIVFGLLLAVGWTNVAQAQLLPAESTTKKLTKRVMAPAINVGDVVTKRGAQKMSTKEPLLAPKALNRAPLRENGTITADVTHPKSWYENIKYNWVDGNGTPHPNVSITEPATDPYQMAYLLGTTYMNPDIPGIQYSAAQGTVAYDNIEFGWDLPGNARWNPNSDPYTYNDIVISYSTNNYIRIYSIEVKSGNHVITSYSYAIDGNTWPTPDGWTLSGSWSVSTSTNYFYPTADGATITIPGSLMTGYDNVTLVINLYDSSTEYYAYLSVNGTSTRIGEESPTDYTWTIDPVSGGSSGYTSITPPSANGYTVFLVKVKDEATSEPRYTSTWSEVINYFDTHIAEIQLLTDGTRLNEDTDDAGTMFSYSGDLNRFYFISKGKNYALYPYYNSDELFDGPPTYCMYEEFSAHQPYGDAADIEDFYSKLLYGNSYNVVHDCQGVNMLEHYFSMSGKTGTEHRSLTNLVFWIPDHRGVANNRTYDEEYLPHVGLYTITLEAEAEPVAHNYVEGNRNYEVTLDWVSSLNTILDFDVDQDYELWIYTYDENGNPVASEKIIEHLQDQVVHNDTHYSYLVEQKRESYTIVYRVKGWPKDATNTPGHYPNDPEKGSFFALSNLAPVLIPGWENFLSLNVEHYESDFVINEEHNYYRNFLTVDNQNPDDVLTTYRITNGEGNYELKRFNVDKPDELPIKAADLTFSVEDYKVKYNIDYSNQFYIDNADQSGNSKVLTGYTDQGALGCPTSGVIANLSGGSGGSETPSDPIVDQFVRINSLSDLVSGEEYLIVCENNNVAFNGGLTTLDATGNTISVTPSNGIIPANATTNAATFTITSSGSGYTIKSKSGRYIANASTDNGLTADATNAYVNTISFDGNNANISYTHYYTYWLQQRSYTSYLRYNYASNQRRFRYFGSGQTAIQLYKRVTSGGTEVTSTWDFEFNAQVNDWSFFDIDGDGYNWVYDNSGALSPHSGSGVMYSLSYLPSSSGSGTALTPNNWMLSPEVDLGGTLTLWARGYDPDDPAEKFGVYVCEGTPTYTSDFTQVGADVTTTNTWTKYTFNLRGFSGKGYIAIVHHNVTNMLALEIDDICLTNRVETDDLPDNNFIDNMNYTQPGIVVLQLPWKSIQLKLQDNTAGTSGGYFMIQNNGRLRFIMPAGYNNASVKFVIRSAANASNYHDGTFTLTSSTSETKSITVPQGGGSRDYEAIFTNISSGDVITITGTHTVDGLLYNYSPDFKYIHVYIEGGHDGISVNDPLNLDAIKFVDQFKANTSEDEHAKRYGYVLKAVGGNKESAKPEVPVQHTGSKTYGYYSLNEIQGDTVAPLLQMNVMNADVNMTLSREPDIYFYTLDRKPSNQNNAPWEEISKLQRREDDTYQEMDSKLADYNNQICNPPTDSETPWIVERYDNDIVIGGYNSFMSYVPVVWTHGDQDNRRVKWDTEKRHNSYGAPIWKTGVAEVNLISATAERQESPSTKWTYGGEDCSLYMLDNIVAEAKLPTSSNINYVPYMFRIFVVSENHKLRGYKRIADGVDEERPGSHYDGDVIIDDSLKCVWSGYVNDPNNGINGNIGTNGVIIDYDEDTGIYTFRKNKVDRSNANGAWDKDKENAIFASLENIIKYEDGKWKINPQDLTIVVRFYFLVEGFNDDAPSQSQQLRSGNGNDDPAGSGAEGSLPPSGWTGLNDLLFSTTVESVTYVNPQGMRSDSPFEGLNIVITRYSDGRVTTTKVLK